MPSVGHILMVAAIALIALSKPTDALAKRACGDAKFADQYATIQATISACEAVSGVPMVSPLSTTKKQTLCDKCPDLGAAASTDNWPICYVVAAGEQLNIRTLVRRWFKPCVSIDATIDSSSSSSSATGATTDLVATVAPSDDSAVTPTATKTPKPSTTKTPKPSSTPKASKTSKANKSSDGSGSAGDSPSTTPKPSKTPKPSRTPKPKAKTTANATDTDASTDNDDDNDASLSSGNESGVLGGSNSSHPLVGGSKAQSKTSTGSSIRAGAIAGIIASVVALVIMQQC